MTYHDVRVVNISKLKQAPGVMQSEVKSIKYICMQEAKAVKLMIFERIILCVC